MGHLPTRGKRERWGRGLDEMLVVYPGPRTVQGKRSARTGSSLVPPSGSIRSGHSAGASDLDVGDWLFHDLEVGRPPGAVEGRLLRAVDTEVGEPSLARRRLNPP